MLTTTFLLMAYSILLFSGCKRAYKIPEGLWKLERVEVLRNNELTKIIDTGFQYWKFFKTDSIQISDEHHVQKRLKIKPGSDSFASIDCKTGNIMDEFVIEKLDKKELELSSRKRLERADYTVVYHLQKIK